MNSPDAIDEPVVGGDEEALALRWRPRESEVVSVKLPKTAIASLEKVAANKDTSVQGLLKFYIGQGLRRDLADLQANQVLAAAAQVLAEHLQSPEQVEALLKEIRQRAMS